MIAKLARLRMWITRAQHEDGRPARRAGDNRGVALLFALLLLVMMSALGLIMVLTVSPDMMINGYYGNYRGSFYAADSGMNIARQQLLNLVDAQVNMTPCADWENPLYCNFAPIANPGNVASAALTSMKSSYGNFTPLQGGQAAHSWPENFEIADNGNCANTFAPAAGYPQKTHSGIGVPALWVYGFNYNLCSLGRAQKGLEVATTENGLLLVNITGGTTNPGVQNFSIYGGFINDYPPCLGPLVPGTMTGRMFANTDPNTHQTSSWQFMPGGAYIFTDPVGQTDPNADFWFGGNCIKSPTSSYTRNGQTIRPTFQQGLQLNQPAKGLPQNSFSQEWAVLDSMGCGEGSNHCGLPPDPLQNPSPPAVTHSDLNAKLKNISGTAYPVNGTNTGVFFPYTCAHGSCTYGNPPASGNGPNLGGGFYIEGNAAITLSIGKDALGNPTQTYTIAQGATTTTITTNNNAQTTTVVSGGTTLHLSGVPLDLANSPAGDATMLYVNGKITSLTGTGQGVPAIQDNVAVNITAVGDINITGDVIYAHEPVTTDTNDTLVPGGLQMNQVLGIFTPSGNIVLSTPYSAPHNNLQVDGSQAAIGTSCAPNSCGFKVSGCINTFNNVGGQIQFNIFGACMNTENTYFDRRYTARTDGFAPPWFPATQADPGNGNAPTPTVTGSAQRLSWVTTPH